MGTMIKSLAVATALGAALSANAAPILGTAGLSFGQVRVTFGNVDWNGLGDPADPPPNAVVTTGPFQTNAFANNGSFAAGAFLTGVVTGGTINDLSANPADANFVPIGNSATPISTNFLTFAAAPGWQFDAYSLASGTFPSSPYVLTQQGGNVFALITVRGLACDTGGDASCDPGDDVTQFSLGLSTSYNNTTVAAMAALLVGPDLIGGTLDDGALPNQTWSGNLEMSVPEPGTLALMGLSLIGLAGLRRRQQVK